MQNNKSKFNTVFSGPIMNRSGYGVYADWLAHTALSYSNFDTIIIPIQFGSNVPRQVNTAFDKLMLSRIPKVKIASPHIYLSCQLPNLDQPKGMILNINFNAGIETSKATLKICEGLKQWNQVCVMSEFSKQVYLNTTPTLTVPISVINPGIDTSIFKFNAPPNDKVNIELAKLKEQEAFLFVGQLTHSNPMLDRKNMALLMKLFCQTFKGISNKPALILKTGGTNHSTNDRNYMLDIIKQVKATIPGNDVTIALLHGELSDLEMASLYNHPKVIAHISISKGEGYGLPLLEASMSGKPILASDYSGYLDFLGDKFIKLPGQLTTIPNEAISEYFPKDSQWFSVNEEAVCEAMKQFYSGDRQPAINTALKLAECNSYKFNMQTTINQMHAYYTHILNQAMI